MSNRAEQADAPDEPDIAGWVRKAQAGDRVAFDELVTHFQRPMFNLAYRMVNNPDDAADLTQEIFVKMYRAIGKFQGRSKFSTWLYALASNTCRSGLRKLRRVSSREVMHLDEEREGEDGAFRHEMADPGDLPDRELERLEMRQKIERVIAGLPEDFQDVVILRDLQGLAYDEIAEALGCSMGTVKSRLARGRNRVKEKLVREGLQCNAMT